MTGVRLDCRDVTLRHSCVRTGCRARLVVNRPQEESRLRNADEGFLRCVAEGTLCKVSRLGRPLAIAFKRVYT
jgi:hypothetical protein